MMTGIMTEDEPMKSLIERARCGDREAFDSLARDVRGRLVAFVQSRLGQPLRGKLDPEDVVQETLLRAFEAVAAFRGADVEDLWKWLASIAEHLIWNASRKRSLKETSLTLEDSDHRVSPSRGLRRKERLARLEESLSGLQPEQREVIVLAKIEGLKAREIAARLGRTEEAVRQILSRGLKALRQRFGDTESLHLPERDFEGGLADELE